MEEKDEIKEEQEKLAEENLDETKEETGNSLNENEEEKSEEVEQKSREEELEEEVAKWKDSYVRKVAEFENIKKRMQKEKEDFKKYASEKLIIKLLEAVDNLERGITSSKQSQDFESLVKGVEMTLGQMHRILKDEGVEVVESLGKEFNPYEHHAMMQEESSEHKDNEVIMELQKGYRMKDKVIRPALVKVAKNKK